MFVTEQGERTGRQPSADVQERRGSEEVCQNQRVEGQTEGHGTGSL